MIFMMSLLLFILAKESHGMYAEDGLSHGNRYALYRLLIIHQGDADHSPFTIRWEPDCSLYASVPFFDNNKGYFSHCKSLHNGFAFSDFRAFQSYNSTYPSGRNDGALWQGVGYNAAFSLGGQFAWNGFRISLNPIIGLSQNRDFELHPYPKRFTHPYSYWIQEVDVVQRMGTTPFLWFDPGESEFSFSYRGFETGFSTSQMVTGPGIQTTLL